METQNPKVIEITPTWTGVLPLLIAGLTNGTENSKGIARQELARMATLADAHAARDPVKEAFPALLDAANECLAAERERLKTLLPGAPATTYTKKRIAKIKAAIAQAQGA